MTSFYALSYLENPKEEPHYHADFELIYVLRGTLTARSSMGDSFLQSGDVYLINPGLSHQLCEPEHCVVASLTLYYQTLAELLDTQDFVFMCNTSQDRNQSHSVLTEWLGRFLMSCQHSEGTITTVGILLQVLDCLVSRYLVTINTSKGQHRATSMELVLAYIAQHYWERLSLSELCDRFFYTTSTFSRLFRKYTGTTFVQYLNQVRLTRSLQSLLQSDMPISTIALENGFSSTAVYDKTFREHYGCSPRQYRMEFSAAQPQSGPFPVAEEAQILEYIEELNQYQSLSDGVMHQAAKIDTRQSVLCPQIWSIAANAGSVRQLLSYDVQNLLQQYVSEIGCSMVRVTDVQELFFPARSPETRFRAIERVLSFLTAKLRVTPIFVFHPVPEKEKTAFMSAVADFLQHIMRRFPTEQAKSWSFEILCNIDRETELEQYSELSSLIRLFIPNALVGGFGIRTGSEIPPRFKQWLRSIKPPDFLSIRAYPPEIRQNLNGQTQVRSSMNIEAMVHDIRKLKAELSIGTKKIPLWVSEWNITDSNTTIINDSVAKAAYMTQFITQLMNEIDLGIYSAFCDWPQVRPDSRPLTGAGGLLSRHGLAKPAYYPISYMRSAGERLLQKGEHYFLTKDRDNYYWGLCYNSVQPNYSYFLKPEEEIGYHDLHSIFESRAAIELTFELRHVQNGSYCVKRGTLGESASILDVIQQMGDPELMAVDDYNYLRNALIPKDLQFTQVEVTDGVLRYRTLIRRNEMQLIHIYPLKLSLES